MAIYQDIVIKGLQAINRCIIYMRVITLTDVTNIVGTHILREMIDFDTPINSRLKWPKQKRPGL